MFEQCVEVPFVENKQKSAENKTETCDPVLDLDVLNALPRETAPGNNNSIALQETSKIYEPLKESTKKGESAVTVQNDGTVSSNDLKDVIGSPRSLIPPCEMKEKDVNITVTPQVCCYRKRLAARKRLSYYCPFEDCGKRFATKKSVWTHIRNCRFGVVVPVSSSENLTNAKTVYRTVKTSELMVEDGSGDVVYACPNSGCKKLFGNYSKFRWHNSICDFYPFKNVKPRVEEWYIPFHPCPRHSESQEQVVPVSTAATDFHSEPLERRRAAIKAKNKLKFICNMPKVSWNAEYLAQPRPPDLCSTTLEIMSLWCEEIAKKGKVTCDIENCSKAYNNEVDMLYHWRMCGTREPSINCQKRRAQNCNRNRQIKARRTHFPWTSYHKSIGQSENMSATSDLASQEYETMTAKQLLFLKSQGCCEDEYLLPNDIPNSHTYEDEHTSDFDIKPLVKQECCDDVNMPQNYLSIPIVQSTQAVQIKQEVVDTSEQQYSQK